MMKKKLSTSNFLHFFFVTEKRKGTNRYVTMLVVNGSKQRHGKDNRNDNSIVDTGELRFVVCAWAQRVVFKQLSRV